MRIATRIAAGQLAFIVLLLAFLLYQISLIHTLQSINRSLSNTNFTAAKYSLQLRDDLEGLEEFTRKLFATSDWDYRTQVISKRQSLEQHLENIRSLPLSQAERAAVAALELLSRRSSQSALLTQPRNPEHQPSLSGPSGNQLFEAQIDDLRRMRAATRRLIEVTSEAIRIRVQQSQETGQRAEKVSWTAAAVALLLSLLVSFLTLQSITRPLGQLVRGTRELAKGEFDYRVDDSGTDELAQLAGDFNAMADQLSKLDQLKDDFVSHVSHELKAPLASMQETTQLLIDQLAGPINPQQEHLLALQLRSGRRLSAMIANLLEVSRMEAEAVEYGFASEDLAALVQNVLTELAARSHDLQLRLELAATRAPLPVECDGARIHQVITNLLENAFKFAPQGSTITVRIDLLDQLPRGLPEHWQRELADAAPDFALISVADRGPGVQPAHRFRIFEKFHQIKRGSKVAGQGVGLGLAICRSIVEHHRGAIWVEERAGGGSNFLVLLRVRQPRIVVGLPRSLGSET